MLHVLLFAKQKISMFDKIEGSHSFKQEHASMSNLNTMSAIISIIIGFKV